MEMLIVPPVKAYGDPPETIIELVDRFTSGWNSTVELPDLLCLNVEYSTVQDAKRNKITCTPIVSRPWPEQAIKFGEIVIEQVIPQTDCPYEVRLFTTHPDHMLFFINLALIMQRELHESDGTPQYTVPPWEVVPDNGYDRELVRLLHKGLLIKHIANRLGKTEARIYQRKAQLAEIYGSEIIPPRRTPPKKL